MAAITIAEVSKIFHGNVEAVKSVSIDIEDGEFIVLVGPSGCGKSTLLRMVAGLETMSKGTVTIGSRVINDVDPAERGIAVVFQNYALYPHMTVYDNLAYALRNRKTAEGRDRCPRRRSRPHAGDRALSFPQAPRALRRPAPARRHGPRHRAQASGHPLR